MGPSENRVASLHQLLEFEQHKLYEFRRQQSTERAFPHGHPEHFDPDIRSCEQMIRFWKDRLSAEMANDTAA